MPETIYEPPTGEQYVSVSISPKAAHRLLGLADFVYDDGRYQHEGRTFDDLDQALRAALDVISHRSDPLHQRVS
jgi:hypothetical protein